MPESKLAIEERQEENTAVFALSGRIDTATAPELEAKALAAMEKQNVAFDMTGVGYVSSAGLRVMIQCHKKAMAAGHVFTLRNLSPNVREVFAISGMINTLKIQ